MKLNINKEGFITGFTSSALNYREQPGVEYSGEIPKDFVENFCFYQYEKGALVLDEKKLQEAAVQEAEQREVLALREWFSWYDNQCMQYARAQRLGESFDQDIEALDTQARCNQLRMRQLQKKG